MEYKLKRFFFFIFFTASLCANEISEVVVQIEKKEPAIDFDYINSLEKGLKRDFFINEYLKSNISSNEAFKTLSLIDNMNNEIFFNFAKKFKDDETLAVAQCMNMTAKQLVETYADCIVSGLTIEKMSNLSAIDLDLIKQKTIDKYPIFVNKIKILSSSIPFTKLIIQKKDLFYEIFFNVNEDFRTKYFNYKLPKRTFQKIFKDKNKFNEFLKISLLNKKLSMLHKSLNGIEDKDLNAQSSFLLALNAIRFDDLNLAYKYLINASKKSQDSFFLEKVNFWKYQITKDTSILEELILNKELNFYTLLSNETLQKEIKFKVILEKKELFDLYTEKINKQRTALLYSIAKSKSNLEAEKISKNFEIGIMQLKPSVANEISKILNEQFLLSNQFKAQKSLEYGNIYLDNSKFKSPILTLFSYENEIENFDELINNKTLFNFFFNLELFLENHKNKLLRQFLINYVKYYNNILLEDEKQLSLISIFQSLYEPAENQKK